MCGAPPLQKHLAKVKAELEKRTGLKSASAIGSRLEEERRHILFVHGSGKRKSPQQREWEEQWTLLERWKAYEQKLAIMGDSRNSYSKTDPDATFMRMKEDHMRNGQLKPGYNVQIAVNSEYITGLEVFPDRSDAKTFRPMMRKLTGKHGKRYKECVTDAGYESQENYLYLAQNGQVCFIKPANYDQKKTKKFKRQIGRIENMAYCHDDDCFICAQGRKLRLRREMTEQQNGQFVTTAWYRCENCAGCPCRAQCCRAKDPNQPKEVVMQRTFWEKREQAARNISSGRGIHLRLCRSIQVEGAFALLKNDFGFRRFLTRGKGNIRTELFFLALAFDLKKLWMKREHNRLNTRVSPKMVS